MVEGICKALKEEMNGMEFNVLKVKFPIDYLTVFTYGSPQYKLLTKTRSYQFQMINDSTDSSG